MSTSTRVGVWVLGDQLHQAQRALATHKPGQARVLLIESSSVLGWRAYHRQKLVLVWSAMRHFAAELRAAGWAVDLLEASGFGAALASWTAEHGIRELHVMEPAERPFRERIMRAVAALPAPQPRLVWHASNAFLWSPEAFATWASGYSSRLMRHREAGGNTENGMDRVQMARYRSFIRKKRPGIRLPDIGMIRHT